MTPDAVLDLHSSSMPHTSPRARSGRVLVLLLALCATLAGCASGSTGSSTATSTTSPPLDKATFAARANAICADAEKKIVALVDLDAPVNADAASTDQLSELRAKIAPIGRDAIAQLDALTPPAADQAMIDAGLAQMRAVLDDSDPSSPLDPIGNVNKALYDYGLQSCFTAS